METIELYAAAPPKPARGAPCNGCGVCCAAEPCPVALLFLFQRKGRCRALLWQAEDRRYVCGMVTAPRDFIRFLPRAFAPAASRFLASRITAGGGCDCDIELADGRAS